MKTEIEKLEHDLVVEQTQLASAHTRHDLASDDITRHDLAVKKIMLRMMKLKPSLWIEAGRPVRL